MKLLIGLVLLTIVSFLGFALGFGGGGDTDLNIDTTFPVFAFVFFAGLAVAWWFNFSNWIARIVGSLILFVPLLIYADWAWKVLCGWFR